MALLACRHAPAETVDWHAVVLFNPATAAVHAIEMEAPVRFAAVVGTATHAVSAGGAAAG